MNAITQEKSIGRLLLEIVTDLTNIVGIVVALIYFYKAIYAWGPGHELTALWYMSIALFMRPWSRGSK